MLHSLDYYAKYKKYKNKYMELKAQYGASEMLPMISIQNPPDTPWLDWIEQGKKKFEGRLNKGIFQKVNIGDIIILYDRKTGKQIKVKVTEKKYYITFVKAFEDLGKELVPVPNATNDLVEKLYHKYFTPEDIRKFGVVAIGVKPIK